MTVKIPRELVERLKPFGPRFIKVAKPVRGDKSTGKAAIEHGYLNRPYKADDPELLAYLENNGSYGVLASGVVFLIDIDDREEQERFEEHVETFVVRSGGGGWHNYLQGKLTENGTIIRDGQNLGNVQVVNKHVVGPSCGHHSGGIYEIIKDLPLAYVTKEQLDEIFGESLQWSGKSRAREEEDAEETKKFIDSHIPIDELIDASGFNPLPNGELQGEHPIHGSTTGTNFSVNVEKNIWHCWRCNSGGGPLNFLVVKEGLIECHESKPGMMVGKLFLGAVDIARELGYEIAKMDGEEQIPERAWKYFEGKAFIPARLAEEMLVELHIRTVKGPAMFVYNQEKGCYDKEGEVVLRKEIYTRLGEAHRVNRRNETLDIVKTQTWTTATRPVPEKVAVENGILNVLTGEIGEFTPNIFITSKLPVHWDPGADQSVVRKFISEIVDGEDQRTLQEFAGYCLYGGFPFHIALMLIGSGSNGKSKFILMLEALLGGEENVSNISLQALEVDRFAVSRLHGKMANFAADISRDALKVTGKFKRLTGGDTVEAQKKFGHRFTLLYEGKMIFSCNEIPPVQSDWTNAFFRRWSLVKFPHTFEGENDDPFILDKLTTPEALSGVLAWAVEGLQSLMERGGFADSRSTQETKEMYIKISDPGAYFVDKFLDEDRDGAVHKADLYKAFKKWCRAEKLKAPSKGVFATRLQNKFDDAETKNLIRDGIKARRWHGVSLSSETRKTRYFTILTSPVGFELNTNKNEESKESIKGAKSVFSVPPERDSENWLEKARRENQ